MSALILKSGNALNASVDTIEFSSYKARVISDGGYIADESALKEAFAFVLANNIAPNEVFSATSARWGVKLSGDKPKKLYSLFDSSGDIDISVGAPNNIYYNDTRYANPVVEMKGSVANALITQGKTGVITSSGLCIITKVPVLASGADYGNTGVFVSAELANIDASIATSDATARRTHIQILARNGLVPLPPDWHLLAFGYGEQGAHSTASYLTNMANWSHTATFLTQNKFVIYNAGNNIAEDLSVTPNEFNNDLAFNIGRGRNTSGAGISYSNAFYGDIAEAWCLINTTETKMQALSLRASQKYANV